MSQATQPSKAKSLNFTVKTLEALPLPEGKGERVKYKDAKEPKLYCYVRNSGAKSYYLDGKVKSKKRNIKLGEVADMLPEAARAEVRRIVAEIETGTWVSPTGQKEQPAAPKRAKVSAKELLYPSPANYRHLRLRDVLADMERHRDYSQSQKEIFERVLRLYAPTIADKPLAELTRSKVQEVITAERKRGGEATAAQTHRTIRAAWNYARAMYRDPGDVPIFGECPTRVLNETRTAPEVEGREVAILPEDLATWWEAIDGYFPKNPRWQDSRHVATALAKCLLLTGWRVEQMRSLRWQAVDLKRGVFNVTAESTKNRTATVMPMCDTVRELLEGLRARFPDSPYVFPSPLTAEGYFKDLRPILAQASEAIGYNVSAHALRHSFLSYGEACGFNDVTLKRLAGHKVSGKHNVTAGYMRSFPFALRNAANGVEQIMFRIMREGVEAVMQGL